MNIEEIKQAVEYFKIPDDHNKDEMMLVNADETIVFKPILTPLIDLAKAYIEASEDWPEFEDRLYTNPDRYTKDFYAHLYKLRIIHAKKVAGLQEEIAHNAQREKSLLEDRQKEINKLRAVVNGINVKDLSRIIKETYTWEIYDDKNPHMLVSDTDIGILAQAIVAKIKGESE